MGISLVLLLLLSSLSSFSSFDCPSIKGCQSCSNGGCFWAVFTDGVEVCVATKGEIRQRGPPLMYVGPYNAIACPDVPPSATTAIPMTAAATPVVLIVMLSLGGILFVVFGVVLIFFRDRLVGAWRLRRQNPVIPFVPRVGYHRFDDNDDIVVIEENQREEEEEEVILYEPPVPAASRPSKIPRPIKRIATPIVAEVEVHEVPDTPVATYNLRPQKILNYY